MVKTETKQVDHLKKSKTLKKKIGKTMDTKTILLQLYECGGGFST